MACISHLFPAWFFGIACGLYKLFVSGLQAVSSQFVTDIRVGALVLGLYGMVGRGKSTFSKALCDYFYGKFSGRVCHVDMDEAHVDLDEASRMKRQKLMGEASRMKRQKLMLKALCGFEKDVLGRITNVGQVMQVVLGILSFYVDILLSVQVIVVILSTRS